MQWTYRGVSRHGPGRPVTTQRVQACDAWGHATEMPQTMTGIMALAFNVRRSLAEGHGRTHKHPVQAHPDPTQKNTQPDHAQPTHTQPKHTQQKHPAQSHQAPTRSPRARGAEGGMPKPRKSEGQERWRPEGWQPRRGPCSGATMNEKRKGRNRSLGIQDVVKRFRCETSARCLSFPQHRQEAGPEGGFPKAAWPEPRKSEGQEGWGSEGWQPRRGPGSGTTTNAKTTAKNSKTATRTKKTLQGPKQKASRTTKNIKE